MKNSEALEAVLTTTLAAVGCDLWGYELQAQGQLRVYIDSKAGVTIDDCSQAAEHLSAALEVEQVFPDYALEVSSPGIERPLFRWQQYLRYANSQVKVCLKSLHEGHRQYSGTILEVSETQLTLRIGTIERVIPYELIERGHLVLTELLSSKQKK